MVTIVVETIKVFISVVLFVISLYEQLKSFAHGVYIYYQYTQAQYKKHYQPTANQLQQMRTQLNQKKLKVKKIGY